MPVITDVADAVVAELNAQTFSLPFEAKRSYQPQFDLAEMKDLHVTVVDPHRAGHESSAIVHAMDWYPTLATLAGIEVPAGRVLDGRDISTYSIASLRRQMCRCSERRWPKSCGVTRFYARRLCRSRGDPSSPSPPPPRSTSRS